MRTKAKRKVRTPEEKAARLAARKDLVEKRRALRSAAKAWNKLNPRKRYRPLRLVRENRAHRRREENLSELALELVKLGCDPSRAFAVSQAVAEQIEKAQPADWDKKRRLIRSDPEMSIHSHASYQVDGMAISLLKKGGVAGMKRALANPQAFAKKAWARAFSFEQISSERWEAAKALDLLPKPKSEKKR